MAASTPDSSRSAPITIGLRSAAVPLAWHAAPDNGSRASDATATARVSLTENPFPGPGQGHVRPLWTVGVRDGRRPGLRANPTLPNPRAPGQAGSGVGPSRIVTHTYDEPHLCVKSL